MHELSYMTGLAELAISAARENGAQSVKKITVDVGELTGVLPEYLHYYFPQVIKGTVLENASLSVNEVPIEAICNDCGNIYKPSRENDYRCPKCGSLNSKITKGRDVELASIEVD